MSSALLRRRAPAASSPWELAAETIAVKIRWFGLVVGYVLVNLHPQDVSRQAILNALGRLGITGVSSVRQGKHFELEVDDSVDDATVKQVADTLLANPVIEEFTISRP